MKRAIVVKDVPVHIFTHDGHVKIYSTKHRRTFQFVLIPGYWQAFNYWNKRWMLNVWRMR